MLSIIIVDFKSIEKTIDYIFHLTERIKTDESLGFVVVDNDEKQHIINLKERFHFFKTVVIDDQKVYCYSIGKNRVAYYHSGKNLGYAKGNNHGCAIAKELFASEYYLISNNDLELSDELYWRDIKKIFDSNQMIGIIGPKVIGLNGNPQSPYKKPSLLGKMLFYYWSMATKNKLIKYNEIDYDGTSKICYRVMGCFWFIKAKIFWDSNGFDENTFMYAEELILAEKFIKNGYLTYFDNDYCVIHRHGETLKNTTSVINGFKWSYESNRYYFKKYRNSPSIILGVCDVNFNLFCWFYNITH